MLGWNEAKPNTDVQKGPLPKSKGATHFPLVGKGPVPPVLAAALRVLMRSDYTGPPLTLYRGAKSGERRRRLYGFSWSTDLAIARKFAENWSQPGLQSEGVVLQVVVPAEAILLVRKPEDYFDDRANSGRMALQNIWN